MTRTASHNTPMGFVTLLIPLLFSSSPVLAVVGPGAGYEVSGIAARSFLKEEADRTKRCRGGSDVECGWWFQLPDTEDKPAEEKEDDEQEKPPQIIVMPDPAERCKNLDSWSKDCGFVNPNKDFDFQSKQREALLNWAVMEPENPQSVYSFQKYTQWMVNQAMLMSRMWEWNMVQHPELDPNVARPVAHFALSWFADAELNYRKSVWDSVIAQGGMIIWFTRSDCQYCHNMLYVMKEVEKTTNIPVWNASLDTECMPGFENRCLTISESELPASILQVNVVPSVFLHLSDMSTWIRVSTGAESASTIQNRITVFFESVKSAVAKGMSGDGVTPAVDFSGFTYGTDNWTTKATQGGMSPGVTLEITK